MSAVHKFNEDLYEDSFTLIALHSGLEDYAMVYAINQELKSKFKRSLTDLDLSENISFPYFEWRDDINDSYWALMTNTSIKEAYSAGKDLFNNEPSFTTHYLVPEYKEVDYFLKIEQDDFDNIGDIVRLLFAIPMVQTAYKVNAENLKSKNNLIF